MDNLNVLFVGDIVGKPGRTAAIELIPELKKELNADYCIANGENCAGGKGLTYVIAKELFEAGIDVITMGNHTFANRGIFSFIESEPRVLRPVNYAKELPGSTSIVIDGRLGVINAVGRTYMTPADCPFRAVEKEVVNIKEKTRAVIVDFHAEATSEKAALAWFLNGRVSAVIGTHTHVQTCDEKILDFGTAFITDVGMTGPKESILGIDREIIVDKFLKGLPVRFNVAKGTPYISSVFIKIDETTGKAVSIKRIIRELN